MNIVKNKAKLKYIFVHGTAGWGSYDERYKKLPYWGMRGGDLIAYLRKRGFDSYAASVSPSGSAWDRACELYAQLYGTKTDYGVSHSSRFGHERFGKDFSDCPLVTDIDEETKFVLIGHSFGGTAVRMYAELMAHGDQQERDVTDENGLSPLFQGGREDSIHSLVCIASALNGNSGFSMLEDPDFDINAVKIPWWSRMFEKRMSRRLSSEHAGMNPLDCGDYDMHIDNARLLNERMCTLPDVYYYSVPCCYTKKEGNRIVPEKDMEPFFIARSCQLGAYTGKTSKGMRIDKQWQRNDGRVSTISQTAPFNAPSRKLDPESPVCGIWNICPLYHGDHMSLQGGLLYKKDIRAFYDNLLGMIARTA